MAERVLVLFDDRVARDWLPFTLTRPAGELLFGTMSLRARSERRLGLRCIGHLTSESLEGFEEPDSAPVLSAAALADGERVLLSSRVVLESGLPAGSDRAATLTMSGETVGWLVPHGQPLPDAAALLDPASAPKSATIELEGRVLKQVWELMSGCSAQTGADIEQLHPRSESMPLSATGAGWVGQPYLIAADDVVIEPGVVFDCSAGPIWLDLGVVVRAFTRLAGPSYIGPGTTLLGGSFTAVTTGARCKLRGEIEETVVLGYSNKAHDGFLGHAYMGRWVNLGAMTTNSDLKNNYGTVRIWTPTGEVNTGEKKIGSLLGDHVKTGIGALLNTGTVVGAGSNLFGTQQPPKYVPPFSWGSGSDLTAYALEKFLATAEVVMGRRDVPLTAGQRTMLERAWHATRARGDE